MIFAVVVQYVLLLQSFVLDFQVSYVLQLDLILQSQAAPFQSFLVSVRFQIDSRTRSLAEPSTRMDSRQNIRKLCKQISRFSTCHVRMVCRSSLHNVEHVSMMLQVQLPWLQQTDILSVKACLKNALRNIEKGLSVPDVAPPWAYVADEEVIFWMFNSLTRATTFVSVYSRWFVTDSSLFLPTAQVFDPGWVLIRAVLLSVQLAPFVLRSTMIFDLRLYWRCCYNQTYALLHMRCVQVERNWWLCSCAGEMLSTGLCISMLKDRIQLFERFNASIFVWE